MRSLWVWAVCVQEALQLAGKLEALGSLEDNEADGDKDSEEGSVEDNEADGDEDSEEGDNGSSEDSNTDTDSDETDILDESPAVAADSLAEALMHAHINVDVDVNVGTP